MGQGGFKPQTMTGGITRHTYQAGAVIFREGEPGDCAYIIERGLVSVSSLKSGKPYVIGELAAGDIFGEMALIDDSMRAATVVAKEETELVRIPRDYVKFKLERSDRITKLFLDVVLEKFRSVHHQLMDGISAADAQKNKAARLSTDMRELVIGDIGFEYELQEALNHQQLQLYFQPIIALAGMQLAGFEALVRWDHPSRGLLFPEGFLGAAEESGLVVDMGREVLKQSCEAIHLLRRQSPTPLYVGINASPRELVHEDFTSHFTDTIRECGIDPKYLKLEITEHAFMDDPQGAERKLRNISMTGVSIAIDDFGTGYSSFSYLCRLPIDTLKIDRSFIMGMFTSARTMEIVRALVNLGRSLNLQVIAEGVETREQLDYLRELGCGYAQGFYLSQPLDFESAARFARRGFNPN